MAHEDGIRAQLGDLTNLVQDSHTMLEQKDDAQHKEKQTRRLDTEAQIIELKNMILKMHEDMEADRARYEGDKRDKREVLETIISDLHRQNAEQRELLQSLSDSKRS